MLGREAKLGRELRDDNYRLEESLHAYVLPLAALSSSCRAPLICNLTQFCSAISAGLMIT